VLSCQEPGYRSRRHNDDDVVISRVTLPRDDYLSGGNHQFSRGTTISGWSRFSRERRVSAERQRGRERDGEMESACVSALNPLQTACPLERVWLASSNTCIDLLTTVVERISPVLAADNSISCMRSRVCILYCIHQFPAIVCSSESMLCIDSRRAFDHTADAEIEYGMSAPCSHKALNACRNAKIPPCEFRGAAMPTIPPSTGTWTPIYSREILARSYPSCSNARCN
jgi:hypothetical protein